MKFLSVLLLFLILCACSKNTEKTETPKNQREQTQQEKEEHHHDALNGGILTELGEHAASLEWLLEEGVLKLYIHDGCAEKPIRISQEQIQVTVKAEKTLQFFLSAETNKLTGEKPGDSNTFSVKAPELNKEKISDISVHFITIKGMDYKSVNLKVK